jgi:hypothetical protein
MDDSLELTANSDTFSTAATDYMLISQGKVHISLFNISLLFCNNFVPTLTLSYLLAVSPNLAFFRPGFLKKILR